MIHFVFYFLRNPRNLRKNSCVSISCYKNTGFLSSRPIIARVLKGYFIIIYTEEPGYLDTRKRTGTSCQIEIHFFDWNNWIFPIMYFISIPNFCQSYSSQWKIRNNTDYTFIHIHTDCLIKPITNFILQELQAIIKVLTYYKSWMLFSYIESSSLCIDHQGLFFPKLIWSPSIRLEINPIIYQLSCRNAI
jgi:hypothetical protein